MARPRRARVRVAVSLCLFATGAILDIALALNPNRLVGPLDALVIIGAAVPSAWLGLLLIRRLPDNPTGPALVALGAAVVLTEGIETWGGTFATADPWPAARLAATVGPGVWVFNLAGFFLLCLVFPNGLLPGRAWRALPWLGLAAAVFVNAMVSLVPEQYAHDGGVLPGATPLNVAIPVRAGLLILAAASLLTALGFAVASIVIRYRRGDAMARLQLRWMVLGAGSVPVLLVGGWVADGFGAPVAVAFVGFMVAMLVIVPVALTIAILKHELFDVDRLLSASAAWVITSLVAAGMFALMVTGATEFSLRNSRVGAVGAAFIVALVLLPAHRLIHRAVGQVVDRDRTIVMTAMADFVRRVRDGQAEPEDIEGALRAGIGDSKLRILVRLPRSSGLVSLDGTPAEVDPDSEMIDLRSGNVDVGVALLDRPTTRQLRRARELLVEARMPIEVSRLRLELRGALEDAQASRSRLVETAATERRRLERDLHDGAQQRIVAVGMRLRSIQRTQSITEDTHQELDAAVAALESTVAELRRLAHGVRPARLDDGLEAAIRTLVADSPIPITLDIDDSAVPEAIATTAYFVIAEGLANTLKHARATCAQATFSRTTDGHVIELRDDGIGGATTGLTALHDRVAALGGRLTVTSPVGHGTILHAEF
jgi:signal transduction histidine kinase